MRKRVHPVLWAALLWPCPRGLALHQRVARQEAPDASPLHWRAPPQCVWWMGGRQLCPMLTMSVQMRQAWTSTWSWTARATGCPAGGALRPASASSTVSPRTTPSNGDSAVASLCAGRSALSYHMYKLLSHQGCPLGRMALQSHMRSAAIVLHCSFRALQVPDKVRGRGSEQGGVLIGMSHVWQLDVIKGSSQTQHHQHIAHINACPSTGPPSLSMAMVLHLQEHDRGHSNRADRV